MPRIQTTEDRKLEEARAKKKHWKRWGPYLSERQWGTVREDYSAGGTAWEFFPHDHARSRTYRWGEDGIGGISDRHQMVCFALAMWNGRDPILKERLFGLTGNEGNHGEDVKEQYFYLDSTPTHSYMRMLYKYPQAAFPYAQLVEENRRRGKNQPEFELLDAAIAAVAVVSQYLVLGKGLAPAFGAGGDFCPWKRMRGVATLAVRKTLAVVRGAAGTAFHGKRNE